MNPPKESHKEKYRQTNAKHWCQYCKTFIMNNDLAMKRHDSSSQHQEAVKRFVGKIQKEDREKNKLLREFSNKTGLLLEAQKQHVAGSTKGETLGSPTFYKKPAEMFAGKPSVPVPLLSVRPPQAPVPRSIALKKKIGVAPMEVQAQIGAAPDSSVQQDKTKEKTEKFMAQAAIIGAWEPVSEPSKSVLWKKEEDPAEDLVNERFLVEEKIMPVPKEVEETDEPVEFVKRPATTTSRRNIRK